MDRRDLEASIAADRTRELLEASSDSISSELEHAEGWLREADLARQSGYWQVEVAAGALGALANAWGRLTLWSSATGSQESVRVDLDAVMEDLVELFRSFTRRAPGDEDLQRLQTILDRVRTVYRRVRDAQQGA